MFEQSPFLANLGIALIGLLIYAGIWVLSRSQPSYEQVPIRLGLGLLLVVPLVLAAVFGHTRATQPVATSTPPVASAPAKQTAPDAERIAAAKRAADAAKGEADRKAADEARRAADATKAAADQKAAADAKRAADAKAEADRTRAAQAQLPKEAAPSAAEVARRMAEQSREQPREQSGQPSLGATRAAEAAPPPPSAAPAPAPVIAAEPQQPWDVVPVYYGTDRVRDTAPERISYNAERGKRLELGRALVTVPKAHQVPNVERPWVYKLPFTQIVIMAEREDPAKHFTLKEMKALTRDELIVLVRERLAASASYKDHAIVFVHGFNVSFEAALFRTAQIAYDLKFDGAPFLYSWPSKGAIGLQDYNYDRESTGQAEPYLRDFLDFVTRETGAKTVSIIAHSMGSQLLLPVLREFKRTTRDAAAISQIILAAPDVDRDNFEFLAKEIAGVSRGITMLASSTDRAMEASRRFWGGVPRAGDVPANGPIVVDGVDTIDVTAITTEVFAINHSGYAEKPALLGDIQSLIQSGERPPEKRVPTLARIKTDKGDYWRYPASP